MSHSRIHLVIAGSSNTDLVLNGPRLPRPGESVVGESFHQFAGGKGANQAVAAARAGARVTFIGACGNDDYGRLARAGLQREGIDLRLFRVRRDAPSGVALILIGGADRQNLIGVAPGANQHVKARDVLAAGRCDAVVTQLETSMDVARAAAQLAERHRVPFLLNPAPAQPVPREILELVHTLTPNEHEAETLTGLRDPAAAARRLVKRGCRNVVVTLGARGVLVVNNEGEQRVRAVRVKPVDTVGAGDCFTAWLAVGIAEGMPVVESARRAVRAAAIAVTRPGAQSGMPYRHEII